MLVFLLVVVSIAFVAMLALYMFGPSRQAPRALAATSSAQNLPSEAKPRPNLEGELEKKRRELEEQRKETQELRAELKQAKKKLFDQRDGDKGEHDLIKARAEVERQASLQLEATRGELASALSQLAKLKAENETGRHRKPVGAVALVEPSGKMLELPVPVTAPPAERPERRFRELNEADKEKMDRLEHQAAKDRARAGELEREVKRLKGRTETQNRVYVVTKGELDLVKDKFKALEKRLNRTLLERDLLRRAIRDLEKKSGVNAERTELTPDEIAASDQKVDDRVKAEAAEAERRAAVAKAEPEKSEAPAAPEEASSSGASPVAAAPSQDVPATDDASGHAS